MNLNIASWCINEANRLLNIIQSSSEMYLFVISFFSFCFWLVGKRLCSFSNPDKRKTTIVIRDAFVSISGFAKILIILFLIYLITIFILILFGLALLGNSGGFSGLNIYIITANKIWEVANRQLIIISASALFGILLSIYFNYVMIPNVESSESYDEVEKLIKRLKKLNTYDPNVYYQLKKGCFIGKNIHKKSVYIPWNKLIETHIQIFGTTGCGKGTVLAIIASQCAIKGECVISFDPKFDRHYSKLLAESASNAKKNFHIINLNQNQPPQFNLIGGCSENEIEELFVAGFDLRNRGTDADFYKGKDEDAAILAANVAIKENVKSLPELLKICAEIPEITEQENFWRHLKKLASLSSINTESGLNLEKAINDGDVINIVGSCDNERVKMLQKMLLVRIMQIIKKRDRAKPSLPICVVLDEFKYLLTPTALSALGVVRDFNAHFILAHQSLGDLAECPGISPESAYGAVIDNTSIKILYRINDADHAEKMAKLSGYKKTFVSNMSKNSQQSFSTGWSEKAEYLISPDLITHLPVPSDRQNQASIGILFGIGDAQILQIGRINATWKMPRPIAAPNTVETLNNDLPEELI